MSVKIYNIVVSEDYYFDIIENNKNFSGALYNDGDKYIYIGEEECIRVGSIINQRTKEYKYRIDVFIPMSIWEKIRHLVWQQAN